MILFYGEGRFGNQVFQYLALGCIARPKERVLAVGLEDLQRSLDLHHPRVHVLTCNGFIKRVTKYLVIPLLLRPLARYLRVFTYVYESLDGTPPHIGFSGNLCRRPGLLRHFTFVDGGYYNNASLWTSLFPIPAFAVKSELRRAALKYLDSVCGPGVRPAFIHLRRSDYLTYSTYGVTDLALPAEFYRSAIIELEARIGKRPLVFVTDDPQWVTSNFHDISDKAIPASDAPLDFAIMTECGSGIVSNSTFSLAAALMIKSPELLIAPKFWFGFSVGAWLPPLIKISHEKIIYMPVIRTQP